MSDLISGFSGAPFVPLPHDVCRQMLSLVEIGIDDVVVDLGCGDGRLLKMAVEEFGALKTIGYEISPWPYLKARLTTRHLKNRVKLYRQDLFKADLSQSTILVLYLTPKLLSKLKPKLKKELNPGTRIITARYPLPDFTATSMNQSKRISLWLYQLK